MEALKNYTNALDDAGYVDDGHDIVQIVEFENAFVFICENNAEDEYVVGVFWKVNLTQGADFEAEPRAEGTLQQCRDKFVEVCCEFVPHLNSRVQKQPGKR